MLVTGQPVLDHACVLLFTSSLHTYGVTTL